MLHPDFVVSSDEETQRLVFLLHGYGANGADLIEIGKFWAPSLRLTTFISPNGLQLCDINPIGFQWFGLEDFDFLNLRSGLESSAPHVASFIKDQVNKHRITMDQVALVGFSQGAMLALELMFHLPGLAGIVSYSGGFYGPTSPFFKGPYPPVFLAHGTHDQVVPYVQMALAENELTNLGVNVQTLTCPGVMHGIDIQGLQQGLTFLQQVFSSPSSVVELGKKNIHL